MIRALILCLLFVPHAQQPTLKQTPKLPDTKKVVLPQRISGNTITLVFKDHEETVSEAKARAELKMLEGKPVMTKAEHSRFVALTIALGTTPAQPKCITFEQHVAEVTSWWAAPEREYVPCDDPRVGPPKERRRR